ncbi:uncharacterized protein [Epargyreus clarus]|uniref:uncharacterized protein n=1 Tax=Epargyreus clarus TaxID=520877 RepID=UPI003C2ADEB4
MLSPRDEDDDDSHLCIKCNATIVGIDNYVKHRKERCGKLKNEMKTDLPPIDSLEPSYSLGADVFFQSLELQSSVKKSSLSRLTPSSSISKGNTDRKLALAIPSTSRENPRMSPLETNLRGEDWIGGHSLRIGCNEDNQTKLINAVASISGTVKKDIQPVSYSIGVYNDYKGDDDSEESEDSDEEDEEETGHSSKWKPPPNYTGGKWRPASPEHEEWDIRDEQEHTGGKWKPLIVTEGNDRDDDYDAPPPDHTKGKWVPGAHEKMQIMQTTIQTKGAVQYWCGPCNRRLGSRAIYDKHLMSNLHKRKVLPEQELEFSGHLEPMENLTDKRASRPSTFVNDSIFYSHPERKRQKMIKPLPNEKVQKKKRKRKPVFVQCPGCKSRVRLHLMGKHLISHYHFRKAANTQSSVYRQLILDNTDAIVHQSPFQCSPCKFYTNWVSNFMQHWLSEEHDHKMKSMDGRYWCSFCKYECDTSHEMLDHLSSSEHSEVIAVINRSMPIIIRKKSILRCETCSKEFRYNMEIKHHCRQTGHELAHTASDTYQELHKCQHCQKKFKTSLTLAAHLKSKHKQKAFFCLMCALTFQSSEEAKKHRQTSEHRIKRKENMKKRGLPVKEWTKKCPYCPEELILKNLLELKDHIRRVHPNFRKRCPKCGKSFIFSQEVSHHIKENACQFPNVSNPSSSLLWNCSQCLFTTDSQAECFFHEVLHSEPVSETQKADGRIVKKYPCPICQKTFMKPSLRAHIRQHTFERPFVCSECGANFTRQCSLRNHIKNEHEKKKVNLPELSGCNENAIDEEHTCPKCKKRFFSNASFNQHCKTCIKDDKSCPYEKCTYVGATPESVIRHLRTHGERLKLHECPLCQFKTDQASHLKRHLVCHKGLKPYGCPHCEFTCGSLENLRKHVFNRHSGLFLYRCHSCEYETNMATELKYHYVTIHADKYDVKSAAEAVKKHLMKEKQSK